MGLLQNIQREPVTSLTLREAITAPPTLPVPEAVTTMKKKQLGCVIVVDQQNKPLGTFTERSVVTLLHEDPNAFGSAVVGDHLDPKWSRVREKDPVLSVIKGMQIEDVRFVVVVDEQDCVVALTGQKGIMEYVAEHYPQQVLVQRVGSKPPAYREGA